MSNLNEDVVLEYLIENVGKDLNKNHSVKTLLFWDYCCGMGENIPQDYFDVFISKVTDKKVNNNSKIIDINDSNLVDCLFLESYKSLLSNQVKNLVKDAKTAKDFKAIVAIDTLLKEVNAGNILRSQNSLVSKVFDLAKNYKESGSKKVRKEEYEKLRVFSLGVYDLLKNPFDKKLTEYLVRTRKDLNDKLNVYSKSQGKYFISEINGLINGIIKSIDDKFKVYLGNVDRNYNHIKIAFGDGVWDTASRVNQLIRLQSELAGVKEDYQLVLCKNGVDLCNSLNSKIAKVIEDYNDLKDFKELFKGIKFKIPIYRAEIDSTFKRDITTSSIDRIYYIYSELKSLLDKKFSDKIPKDLYEDYYIDLKKTMNVIKRDCDRRIRYLIEQSARCRQKIDTSFFSLTTREFVKKLKNYNRELEAWSKCQII